MMDSLSHSQNLPSLTIKYRKIITKTWSTCFFQILKLICTLLLLCIHGQCYSGGEINIGNTDNQLALHRTLKQKRTAAIVAVHTSMIGFPVGTGTCSRFYTNVLYTAAI